MSTQSTLMIPMPVTYIAIRKQPVGGGVDSENELTTNMASVISSSAKFGLDWTRYTLLGELR